MTVVIRVTTPFKGHPAKLSLQDVPFAFQTVRAWEAQGERGNIFSPFFAKRRISGFNWGEVNLIDALMFLKGQ